MTDAEREIARSEHLGAGNGDEPALQRAEHRAVPGGHPAGEDHHAVAAVEPGAQEVRPASAVACHLPEAPAVDDPLSVDEGQRRTAVAPRERLDHVTREVEPRRDLPPMGVGTRVRDCGGLAAA